MEVEMKVKGYRRSVIKKRGKFVIKGKKYRNFHKVKYKLYDGSDRFKIYKDRYGNPVLYCFQRYPCFDVHDRLSENRYHRYLFVFEDFEDAYKVLKDVNMYIDNHKILLQYLPLALIRLDDDRNTIEIYERDEE